MFQVLLPEAFSEGRPIRAFIIRKWLCKADLWRGCVSNCSSQLLEAVTAYLRGLTLMGGGCGGAGVTLASLEDALELRVEGRQWSAPNPIRPIQVGRVDDGGIRRGCGAQMPFFDEVALPGRGSRA
jgi:hypothetical protein